MQESQLHAKERYQEMDPETMLRMNESTWHARLHPRLFPFVDPGLVSGRF
jgi:hypothetical protein